MKRKIFILSIAMLMLGSISCVNNPNDSSGRNDFFPLRVGQQWTYKITESYMDTSRIGFPKRVTVSIVGEKIIAKKKYFLMTNYFVPGPSLPDTVLVRNTENHVFIRFDSEHEEYLFYSFTPPGTTWSTPMYVNTSTVELSKAILIYSNNTAAISWDLNGYPSTPPYIPGRTESGWGEIFKKGIGRTEIVSVSQVYGKVVWELEQIQ